MGRREGFEAALLAGVWMSGLLLAGGTGAHPTDVELRAASAERAACEAPTAGAERLDPIRLGMSASELRAAWPDAARVLARAPGAAESSDPDESAAHDSGAAQGLEQWVRKGTKDVERFEYELWQDRIYRIRWALSDAFERPVLDEFVRRASVCLGEPEYDQRFEAEPGSPRATLRRTGWNHADREIELRQLHPLRGGPVYLSVTRSRTLREIAAAGISRPPDPDRTAPWWQRSMAAPKLATAEERERLGERFARLLSQLDH